MLELLIALMFIFNVEESNTQVCHTIIYCECEWSKEGEVCTMKAVTECG